MNINNSSLLPESNRVNRVTLLSKAYVHPLRFEIVELLRDQGSLTPQDVASHFEQAESSVFEQISHLCHYHLVKSTLEDGTVFLSANEDKVCQVRDSLGSLLVRW